MFRLQAKRLRRWLTLKLVKVSAASVADNLRSNATPPAFDNALIFGERKAEMIGVRMLDDAGNGIDL